MYRLEKTFSFEASHQLSEHDGKCRRLHGHSWRVTVIVEGKHLHTSGPKKGMLIDYGDISAAMHPLIEQRLDHWHLNESLAPIYPTSENIAVFIWDYLKKLPGFELMSGLAVRVEETCTSACTFDGSN